ncbi:MAG: PmoA family protein [Methylococcaceae bacterium]|nr:PmoA family protein [Methylococcaceae bacterium]
MNSYQIQTNAQSHFVKTGDRILGAYGTSFWRSWVYPFYTPSGYTVVENSPFDHPFHNGIFVAQNPVRVGEREGNFWALPVKRSHDDHIMKKFGRMDPQGEPAAEVTEGGVRFTLKSIWRDEQEQPMLDEERTVILRALPDATVCDMASRKTAAYGTAEFPKTKFGSICMRVEPRLLPSLGGQVIGCVDGELCHGTADEVANAKVCDAVAYENDVPGLGVYGVCLMILDNSASPDRRGPWFIRDYGLATVNATQNETIAVPAGGVWTAALRIVAYDGPITAERLAVWKD